MRIAIIASGFAALLGLAACSTPIPSIPVLHPAEPQIEKEARLVVTGLQGAAGELNKIPNLDPDVANKYNGFVAALGAVPGVVGRGSTNGNNQEVQDGVNALSEALSSIFDPKTGLLANVTVTVKLDTVRRASYTVLRDIQSKASLEETAVVPPIPAGVANMSLHDALQALGG